MNAITIALDLARLRGHPIKDYTFPFWQAVILLTFIGISYGLDPSIGIPLIYAIILGVLIYWSWYWVCNFVISWWLKRSKLWDGRGALSRVIIASWGIDILLPFLGLMGIPGLLLIPLWLYTLWVMVNAISHATGVSKGSSIIACLAALLVYLFTLGMLAAITIVALVMSGIFPAVNS
ncbi:hypothetical protein [Nitrincola sp.]|uniref:hypothetical protein n=1 Tax=Nitrincola sp. TaxID=1926584 RepID=UPI003A905FCE